MASSCYCSGEMWTVFARDKNEDKEAKAYSRLVPRAFISKLPLERCAHSFCRLPLDAHRSFAGMRLCPGWSIVDLDYFQRQGLDKVVVREGRGEGLRRGDKGHLAFSGYVASVSPTGRLDLGAKFAASAPGTPYVFQIGLSNPQAIRAWEIGCVGMKQGEAAIVVCSSEMAYREVGVPSAGIPRNAMLAFEMILEKIDRKGSA